MSMLLTPYVQSAAPVVAVNTHEEYRFAKAVVRAFSRHSVLSISADGGLKDLKQGNTVDATANFVKAMTTASTRKDTILIVFDLQHIITNAPVYRKVKDLMPALKSAGSMLVLMAPNWRLPEELRYDVPVLEWGLPTRAELKSALSQVATSVQQKVPTESEAALLDAAAGLAYEQAENAYSLAYVERGCFDAGRVADEKMALVKTEGLLEIWRPVPASQIGGLGVYKEYIEQEILPWKDDPQLRIKGNLFVGVPGTGKSLSMKALGSYTGWPVLRLDASSLKGSLVGQSEGNMKRALKMASAVAPCVLGLDELEKAVAGAANSGMTDSGVSAGMLGILLTWMQENTAPVLVVGTCNDYSKLPPELVRRFDSSWFMDLPRPGERLEIAEIHYMAVRCKYDRILLEATVQATDGYTGDEIRGLVHSLARRSGRDPNPDLLRQVAASIKPISVSRAADVDRLRQWATTSIRIANTEEAAPTSARRLKRSAQEG